MYSSEETFQPIEAKDFAALGLESIAFVKRVEIEGETAYAVHAADGTAITVIEDREIAFATVRQNDLEPVSVH